MKILFPKHIKKGIFASMNFNIWPITVSVIQLFILALWIAISLLVFNAVGEGSRALGFVFAIPVFILFVIIAFFKISELPLIPFIAKLFQTYIFDTTKKFQVNYEKEDPTKVAIKEAESKEKKQIISYKKWQIDKEIVDDIENSWLL